MTQIDLTPYHLQRPEKVVWRFPKTTDPLTVIKSKSLRKFLSDSEKLLQELEITWKYETVDQAKYREWLTYYQEKMTESEFDIIATQDWYDKRIEQGKFIEGIFFYQNDKLIGSGIFVKEGTDKATFAFKASDRINIDLKGKGNLGSVIDYFYLREMIHQGIEVISLGKSRNAFGVFNTFGYLSFSLRFGFIASPAKDAPLSHEVPLAENGIVLCYCLDGESWALYAFKPKSDPTTFDITNFVDENLSFKVIEY